MTPETDFIARHVAEIRELAPRLGAGPLSTILAKSASIIEQLRDGLSASRVAAHAAQDEHERTILAMRADLAALQARSEATAARVAELLGAILPVEPPTTAVWKNLPCAPTDLNALIKLMPHGWVVAEWRESAFVAVQVWGLPLAMDELMDLDFHPDPGPGMPHNARIEGCFEAWPDGRTCLAEWDPGSETTEPRFRLLAVDDLLVYSDPEGTPEPATFFMCTACEADLGTADPKPHDHCPICHKDGTLLLMRQDGVRIP